MLLPVGALLEQPADRKTNAVHFALGALAVCLSAFLDTAPHPIPFLVDAVAVAAVAPAPAPSPALALALALAQTPTLVPDVAVAAVAPASVPPLPLTLAQRSSPVLIVAGAAGHSSGPAVFSVSSVYALGADLPAVAVVAASPSLCAWIESHMRCTSSS